MDPYAEHSFHQLSQAIQILLDRDSRKAYDFHRTKVSKLSNSRLNLSEKVQNLKYKCLVFSEQTLIYLK